LNAKLQLLNKISNWITFKIWTITFKFWKTCIINYDAGVHHSLWCTPPK